MEYVYGIAAGLLIGLLIAKLINLLIEKVFIKIWRKRIWRQAERNGDDPFHELIFFDTIWAMNYKEIQKLRKAAKWVKENDALSFPETWPDWVTDSMQAFKAKEEN